MGLRAVVVIAVTLCACGKTHGRGTGTDGGADAWDRSPEPLPLDARRPEASR